MTERASTIIPESKISEIREACNIVAVVSDYVSLRKVGVNHKGLCPFHSEKTPSFFVSETKNLFRCFGCGASGDVFSFLMKHENMSFPEAVRLLARRNNIALPEKPLSPRQRQMLNERERCFRVNRTAADYYHAVLLDDRAGRYARDYLKKRGIGLECIKDHGLGFAPDGWSALVRHLESRHMALQDAHKTGLVIKKDGGSYYDRFRNRIVFPIANVAQHVVGFGGRVIDQGEPKYLNSPESIVYSKRQSLYGLNRAVSGIREQGCVIIVEGYLDLLTLYQAGINNAVASLGTSLTESQIRMLRRYTSEIVTVFDADASGQKAMMRSLGPFLSAGIAARLVVLPEGDDPDSFVQAHGESAFRQMVANAGLLFDFVVESIIKNNDIFTPRGKVNACDEIVPLIASVSDDMERQLYVQKVSQRLGLQAEQIASRLQSGGSWRRRSGGGEEMLSPKTAGPAAQAERLLIKLMVMYPETCGVIRREAILSDFTDVQLCELGSLLIRLIQQHDQVGAPQIMDLIEDQGLKDLLSEILFDEGSAWDPTKILEDCIRSIRLKKNRDEMEKISCLLKQAESAHDEALSIKYQLEFQAHLKTKKEIMQYKLTADHT